MQYNKMVLQGISVPYYVFSLLTLDMTIY